MKRLGILGGTFNPPHRGHLALARAARKRFALDRIIFIPSGRPPHKTPGELVGKEDRYRMVRLAIRGKKGYSISRLELDRPGPSYAVDTFAALRRKYGRAVRLFYIMGLDSLNEILTWKKPQALFGLCDFIVGTRPGSKIRPFRRGARIHLLPLREDISASEIRARLRAGLPIGRLVPKPVKDYIKRKGLYQ